MRLQKSLYPLVRAHDHFVHTRRFLFDPGRLFQQCVVIFLRDQPRLVAVLPQPQIRIVLPQHQTVLRTGGHHTVRLPVLLGHQIVDEHSDVGFRAVQNERFLPLYLSCGVDPGHQALGCRLFVSAAAVELPGAEDAFDIFQFQREFQLPAGQTVVFDRIGIAHHTAMLHARNGSVHRQLHILR